MQTVAAVYAFAPSSYFYSYKMSPTIYQDESSILKIIYNKKSDVINLNQKHTIYCYMLSIIHNAIVLENSKIKCIYTSISV